jgi:sensor domain CHASE-containing protein
MPLRRKVFFILFLTVLTYGVLDYCVQRLIILPSYIALEKDEAQKDIERCVAALNREIEHLDILNHDWAAWDDTYQYVQDKDDEYESSNLVDSSFTGNRLNLIYIFDKNGNKLWGRCC